MTWAEFGENLKVSLDTLRTHKVRSGLTLLGVVIGVTSVIAVASITSTGAISSFSNYGSNTVDLGAPGSSILSTVPTSSKGKIVPGYASYSGTSMATPHVTGAAALYASTHPGATAAQIKGAILSSAIATSSLAGKCVTGGRLNVSTF